MTFRISDLLIRGCLIIIGLTEIAHLAGCLLGWSFLAVTELLLAEIAVAVLVWILSGLIAHKKAMAVSTFAGKTAPENSKTSGRQQILTVVLALFILLQVLMILTGERVWTGGDMTLETVNTFLKENGIYTVDPLTGELYTQGMSFRLKLLCLPTLYGTISRWSGMTPDTVVYRLIPCLTLCMGYLAYGRLGAVLFEHNREKCNIFLIIVGILFCAGTYMPGVDGFDIFYGGFRGVTIRAAVLLPYLFSCLLERKYLGAVLCILAEACMVWTLYGAGMCLLVTVAWMALQWLWTMYSCSDHKKTQAVKTAPGEEDAE